VCKKKQLEKRVVLANKGGKPTSHVTKSAGTELKADCNLATIEAGATIQTGKMRVQHSTDSAGTRGGGGTTSPKTNSANTKKGGQLLFSFSFSGQLSRLRNSIKIEDILEEARGLEETFR